MLSEHVEARDGGHYRKTVLSNGVRIVTERIPSVRSISVGLIVPSGSRDEPARLNGISHFTEHMVFKGTSRRKAHHISRRMESVGGYLNAYTSKEYTSYFARSLDEHLPRAVDILCDLVLEPTFPEKELEKEKGVVLEEIRMYDDVPEDAVFDTFEAIVYKDHPLGRPILGTIPTVLSFSSEDLRRYVKRQYWTEGLLFSSCGNVDHDRFVDLVRRAFDGSVQLGKAPQREPASSYVPGSSDVKRSIQQAHLVVETRSLPAIDKRRAALTLLNTILGGGMSSRLNQNIRERYGFCYNIYSFVNFLSDTGDLGVYVGTEPDKLERSEKLIFRELDRLVQNRVGERTLSQAKNQLKGSLMLGLEDLSSRMMRLGRMEMQFGRYFTLDESLETIDRVSSEDIRNLAEELIGEGKFSRAVFLPESTAT